MALFPDAIHQVQTLSAYDCISYPNVDLHFLKFSYHDFLEILDKG